MPTINRHCMKELAAPIMVDGGVVHQYECCCGMRFMFVSGIDRPNGIVRADSRRFSDTHPDGGHKVEMVPIPCLPVWGHHRENCPGIGAPLLYLGIYDWNGHEWCA